MAAFRLAKDNSDLIIITNTGMVIRVPLEQINVLGRVTQGVRVINLKDNQEVSNISLVDKTPEENTDDQEQEDVVSNEINNQEIINESNNEATEITEETE